MARADEAGSVGSQIEEADNHVASMAPGRTIAGRSGLGTRQARQQNDTSNAQPTSSHPNSVRDETGSVPFHITIVRQIK